MAPDTAYNLTQYGVMGVFLTILLMVVRYLEVQRREREREMQKKIGDLELRLQKYEENDRGRMEAIIQHNSDVIAEAARVIKLTYNRLNS